MIQLSRLFFKSGISKKWTGLLASLHAWVTGFTSKKTSRPTWLGSVTWNG